MKNTGKMRFADDRPKSCEYCYFWQGRNRGCELGGEAECYYRLPDEPEPKKKSECDGCSYGRVSPCIGYCLKKIQEGAGDGWKDRE